MSQNQDQNQQDDIIKNQVKKLQIAVDLYYKYRNTLGWGMLTILTLGGEAIFSNVVFKCPCNATWNTTYGMVFLLVPTLVLAILGFMMGGPNEHLLDSCKECCSCDCKKIFLLCWNLTWTSLLWPLMWIAMALIEGTFPECASSGITSTAQYLCHKLYANSTKNYDNCINELPLVPCKTATIPEVQDLLKTFKAQSQVTGWILVLVIIMIFFINAVVKHVCSSNTFKQADFYYIYKQREKDLFQIHAIEHASELAKANIKNFFRKECLTHENLYTPSQEEWDQILKSKDQEKLSSGENYCTPLQQYAKNKTHNGTQNENPQS